MRPNKKFEPETKTSDIKKLAASLPGLWDGHLLKIIDDDGSAAGLCLVSEHLDIDKKVNLEKKIASCSGLEIESSIFDDKNNKQKVSANLSILDKTEHDPCSALDSLTPEFDQFEKQLTVSFVQAKRTRLPLSLILIQPDFIKKPIKSENLEKINSIDFLIKRINELIDPGDVFCRFACSSTDISARDKQYSFAVIMHSAGMSRAKEKAEEFRRTIKTEAADKEDCLIETLSIGLGAVVSVNKLTPLAFTRLVEKKLIKAATLGDKVIWEQKELRDQSCQVTAEERKQLFRGLS